MANEPHTLSISIEWGHVWNDDIREANDEFQGALLEWIDVDPDAKYEWDESLEDGDEFIGDVIVITTSDADALLQRIGPRIRGQRILDVAELSAVKRYGFAHGAPENTVGLPSDDLTGEPVVAPKTENAGRADYEVLGLPEPIAYLSDLAAKYRNVGGNDVYGLFDTDEELAEFADSLTEEERAAIVTAHETIVENKHHRWISEWCLSEDPSDEDQAKMDQVFWLLAVLDALNEVNMFPAAYQGFELIDWNEWN